MDRKVPVHSFDIATCGQMLQKLHRELERLGRGTFDPQTALDHALNYALTADSMVEWVWQLHFRGNLDAQRQLANDAIRDQDSAPSEFRTTLSERCRAVSICSDLARGTRHVFVERKPRPIVDETNLVACDPQTFALDVSGLGQGVLANDDGSIPSGPQYVPLIKMAGTTRSAIEVFDEATVFWTRFLPEFGIV